MGSASVLSALAIGGGAGGRILLRGLVAIVRVLSWLEADEDDLILDD